MGRYGMQGGELSDDGVSSTWDQFDRLTPEAWRAMRHAGLSNADIARHFHVGRSAVTEMLKRYDVETPLTIADRMWPWDVPGGAMQYAAPYKNLRRHSRWMSTGRDGFSVANKLRLWSFYQKLRDTKTVVAFNPNLRPIPGVSSAGGWSFVDRVRDDRDLIIRVDADVKPPVDDEFREFWSLPDYEEWPKILGGYR